MCRGEGLAGVKQGKKGAFRSNMVLKTAASAVLFDRNALRAARSRKAYLKRAFASSRIFSASALSPQPEPVTSLFGSRSL